MSARSATTGPGLAALQHADHAGVRDARSRTSSKPSARRCVGDDRRGAHLAVAELGVLVEVAPPRDDVGLDRRGSVVDVPGQARQVRVIVSVLMAGTLSQALSGSRRSARGRIGIPFAKKAMRVFCVCCLLSVAVWAASAAHAADMNREQALQAIEQPEASTRLAAVNRLAEIGQMADADRLLGRLGDADPQVRDSAAQAMWRIWSRSGDPAIDQLFARGVESMQAGEYEQALAVFHGIVARKPDFAEGWNKRATLYFLLGRNRESLKDCDEVLKRNPQPLRRAVGGRPDLPAVGQPATRARVFGAR